MSAELEKAKISLEKAEKLQDIMKKANAIIRSGKDVTNKLVEIGLSQDQAEKIQKPDFANRIGFAQYSLTNNNATIKRLKDRVNQLESKQNAAKAGEERYLFDGGSVEVNYSADRVQILFDSIPSAEKRTELKKNGWKWSPTNSAWQRMITPQAISNAKSLTGATGSAPVQEQTGPINTDELLNKRKFSYVTISLYTALPTEYKGLKTFEIVYFDVVSANIAEAIRAYFKQILPEIPSDKIKVSVYAKTYVKESQRLVDQNRFLPNDAPAKIVLGAGLQQIKDFLANQSQLDKGIEVEQEHKETLEKVASKEITVEEAIKATAEDHINEDPQYYDKLQEIESPKPNLRFPELEPAHPLNLLDKESSQYKEALSEYNSKLKEAPKNNSPVKTKRAEFIEYLSDLDGWEQFDGDNRYYRKFVFKKDQLDAARDVLDRGVKEMIADRTDGGINGVISVKHLEDANAISDIYENFLDATISRKNYYTTAPVSADGFGTKTLETTDYEDRSGRLARKVSITDRNLEWQSNRYASGNWMFFDESQFEKYAQSILQKKVADVSDSKSIEQERKSDEIGDPSKYSDAELEKFVDMLSIKSVVNVFPNHKELLAAIKAEQEKRKQKNSADETGLFDYLPEMNHLEKVEKNVDAIAIEYSDRPMAALQVISYLNKHNNPYVQSFMRKHRLDTREKMIDYVGKRQTILRAGKGKERSEFLKNEKEATANKHVDNIFSLAAEQSAEMDAKIKQDNSGDNKILERYPKLTKSEIVNVYNQVEAILGKEQYTDEDKYILEKYEGLGSQTATGVIDKGLLHQFYTPYIIAKKMWDLAFVYGVPKENPIVIEPSMGTGRFFKYAPEGSTCIGFDPDKKNVEIAKILYPNITVYEQEFETAFLEAPRYNRMAKKSWLPEADLCIGNPPYGDYMGYYKSYMPSIFKRFEFLFIYLGLKTLKPGGLLVFIVSQNFMNNGAMYNGMKAKILETATFVDAIRLPNGIFSSTDVGTDIVIFRKK